MSRQHELKILPEYLTDIWKGKKTFELRKNDRGFEVGDTLLLNAYEDGEYTGDTIEKKVSYILAGGQFGLDKEYVILGII